MLFRKGSNSAFFCFDSKLKKAIRKKCSNSQGIDSGITLCYPSVMKTAISIPDEIFKEVEKFAKKHHYSRSKVFALAVNDFLEKLKSRQLLASLNEIYHDIETTEDVTLRKEAVKHYANIVSKKPY